MDVGWYALSILRNSFNKTSSLSARVLPVRVSACSRQNLVPKTVSGKLSPATQRPARPTTEFSTPLDELVPGDEARRRDAMFFN